MTIRSIWLLPLIMMAAGCGGSNLGIVPVAGTITLDGKPLDGATVFFSPADTTRVIAPSSYAKTDSDGRYKLSAVGANESGAISGTHKVTISRAPTGWIPKGDEPAPETLPAKYNRDSKLSFDVPTGGTAAADFALTTK